MTDHFMDVSITSSATAVLVKIPPHAVHTKTVDLVEVYDFGTIALAVRQYEEGFNVKICNTWYIYSTGTLASRLQHNLIQ